jgi:hypothetical protein
MAVAVGCHEELGPVSFPSTRVVGIVTDGGRPVRGGWIEFVPVDGSVGVLRSAPIATNGEFEASGVAVGRNLIGLVGLPGGERGFHTLQSSIRRNIPAGTTTRINIDLLEEAIKLQEMRLQATPGGNEELQ